MPLERYLIAPFDENSGLTTNMRPWQIPDNAWATMDNAYVFRGRIVKRFGSRYMGSTVTNTNLDQLLSRFRVQVGTVGAPVSPVPGNKFNLGQMFSIGNQIFTVVTAGVAQPLLATGPGTGTFSTTNGAFTFAGTGLPGGTPIWWYPTLPVMGLKQYEFTAINNYLSIGFDTEFAYQFINGSWSAFPNTPLWHGSDINFFWAYNWVGANTAATALTRALFVSNFYVTNINGVGTANDDPMYYYDGTNWVAYRAFLNPNGAAAGKGPFVETALIIIPFYGRLILLNTIENDGGGGFGNNINYVNRARWTSVGSPFATNAWYGIGAFDAAGNKGITGGYKDATTLEAIVGAEFIKDHLIVYFEQSTWELVYTGNQQDPFNWQKINTELGSMATFSTVGFDKAILAIGETGVHSCNGSNTIRIDQKIPDEIFTISNPSTETERISGIRDYINEMVYWTIPVDSQRDTQPYPTRVLVYNYQNQTWAFNDDSITTFGYFDGQLGVTWANIQSTWEQWNATWDDGQVASNVRQVIGGNQQGFVFVIDTDAEKSTSNALALYVSGMTQVANGIEMIIYNHNLNDDDYIFVLPGSGATQAGFLIYQVIFVDEDTIIAFYPPEVVEETGIPATITGVYTGGAVAARVSNYKLYSKQWNPYDKDGSNVYVARIDFSVLKTPFGQVTVNYAPSSTPLDEIQNGIGNNSLIGTSILETSPYDPTLYPLEQIQNRLWHPIYFQTDGECIQINIFMSPIQICNPNIAFSFFQLEGMILYTKPTSTRLQ